MRRLVAILSGCILVCPAFSADTRQRVVVEDFEDVGTWRAINHSGLAAGAWFAGSVWMGGSKNARRSDDWVGELRFDFQEESSAPRWISYRRHKMSRISGYLDGIEFDADSRGLPVSLRFVLRDAKKALHTTPALRLGEAGWRGHRLELDEKTWPGLKNVVFPACVEQVTLVSERGGAGSVFIDDLALTGAFSKKDRLALGPVYQAIDYAPGEPFELAYRARNATGGDISVDAELEVSAVFGGPVYSGRAQAFLAARGQGVLRFPLRGLPVGAYTARLKVKGGELEASYDDTVGVFVPNGARINRRPMWFGIQDNTVWQGEWENRLHLEWMKRIGFDINRPGLTAGRFSLSAPRGLDAWKRLLQPFEEAGIDSSLLYFETPAELLDARKNTRTAPVDLKAFERYAADVGTFFGSFPRVRYLEFWNEPDIGFFHGTLEEYQGMFRAFSAGFRSTAPHVRLTTGGSTVMHPKEKPGFSAALYSKDGDIYDVAAFHAHGTLGAYVERQQKVERWQAEGAFSKPIANTESGERSGYDARGRAEQAVTLVKKMTYSKSRPRSEFHIWFTLQDYWDMDPDTDDSFGLITSDNRPKPSLVAYNELIRQLANTDPSPGPEFPAEVAAYAFRRDDGRHVLVCWASEGMGSGSFWIRDSGPVEQVDIFGAARPLNAGDGHLVFVEKVPSYLVSDGPLSPLATEDIPLAVPAAIYRDVKVPTPFEVVVRNPGNRSSSRRLVLRDAEGAEIWSDEVSLAAGASARETIVLPAAPAAGMSTLRMNLEMISETGRIEVPVLAHGSYPIASGEAEALGLTTAQDVTELTFDPAIPAWKSAQDLSVEARISRESSSLVFCFDVTDDRHVQANPDNLLWRGDCVQVAFYNPANGAHTLFDLALRDAEPVAWCLKNADPALAGRWSLPVSIRREEGHTRYEIKVPLAHLGFVPDAPEGTPVRFSFLVNEDDGQGRVRWMSWCGGLGKNQELQQLGHGILK